MNKNQNEEKSPAANLTEMMFAQMARLSDPEADLEKEIKRSNALSSAGTVIINAAKAQLDAEKVKLQQLKANGNVKPKNLGNAK